MSASGDPASVEFTITGPEPFLDDAESKLVGQQRPLVFSAIRVSHGTLRSYASRTDYDTDPIEDSLQVPEVDRSGNSLTIRWSWEHPAASFFEHGTSDHTIHGDPVLSFIWEDPPASARETWPEEGDGVRVFVESVDVSGLPESRFIKAGIEWLRQEFS